VQLIERALSAVPKKRHFSPTKPCSARIASGVETTRGSEPGFLAFQECPPSVSPACSLFHVLSVLLRKTRNEDGVRSTVP